MICFEKHYDPCTCSYCFGDNSKLHYGLNIPKRWNSPTSWYVIKFPGGRYLRWTNRWLRWFK